MHQSSRIIDEAVNVSSKCATLQENSTVLEASEVEEAAGENLSTEEAMILQTVNIIAEEAIDVSNKNPKS